LWLSRSGWWHGANLSVCFPSFHCPRLFRVFDAQMSGPCMSFKLE
jgi:hypothetical protein